MKKKIIALSLAAIIAVTAIASASLAYLMDTDYDKNVMVVGNVKIEQIEQQRDDNGALVAFQDGKKLLPATADPAWTDKITVDGINYKAFGPEFNPVDKIVTVKNTGSESAYIRTIIAFENNENDIGDLIHINWNSTDCDMTVLAGNVTIGEKIYQVLTFTYKTSLESGAVSAPSLVQVFLDKEATNEDMVDIADGYDILVLSQAVQSAGWTGDDTLATAKNALNTAFGEVTAANASSWFANATEK